MLDVGCKFKLNFMGEGSKIVKKVIIQKKNLCLDYLSGLGTFIKI